jgi:hypothetical protein
MLKKYIIDVGTSHNAPRGIELKKEYGYPVIFIDAHWEDYFPLLDELKIIKDKNLKPVIAIHDFYVPDENGNAKFGFDSYHSQPLDFPYIKNAIENLYKNSYEIKYSTTSTINSGVIFIYPKNK